MKPILSTLILCLILISCGTSNKEYISGNFQKVVPGDTMINPSVLTAHHIQYRKASSLSMSNAKMGYRVSKSNFNSKEAWLVEITFNESPSPDSIFLSPADLSYAGRRLSMEGAGYFMNVDMDLNEMTASLKAMPGSDWEPEGDWTHTYDHGMYEIAIMNYFIKALPLEEGLKVSMPYHVFSSKGNWKHYWLDVIVDGKEKVKANGKEYDTWVVQSLSQFDGGKTFWIAEEVPYAIKIHSHGNTAWIYSGDL